MTGLIYYIYHIESGKGYVGKHNKDNLHSRFKAHFKSSSYVSNALRRYGLDSFKVIKLDSGNSDQELNEKEIYWIDLLEVLHPGGYNLSTGGSGGSGWKLSEETRKAVSFALTGYSTGPRSKECREDISKALKGRPPNNSRITLDQVQAIRNSPSKNAHQWAGELGVGYGTIVNIRRYKSFKNQP